MSYQIPEDIKPQFKLLIVATVVSIAIWLVAFWFLPSLSYAFYPLQLFATFIHEGSHVLAALITGSAVQSLSVSPDTSGVVWSVPNGWFSGLFISSAGYLGTTFFGTLLLISMRFGLSSKKALYIVSGFIAMMTFVFGFVFPIFNIFSPNVSLGSTVFTVFSGALLTAGLFATARYASVKWSDFAVAFLAVQCLLNSLFSLKDLFVISASTDVHTDAMNMAQSTGIPSLVWVLIWMLLSVVMISVGLRLFAIRQKSANHDLPFADE
jgi:hypothetical protein